MLLAKRNPQAVCLFLPCAEAGPGCLWRRKVLAHTDSPSRRLGHSHNAARCASHALFEDRSPTVGAAKEREKQICGVSHVRNNGAQKNRSFVSWCKSTCLRLEGKLL